MDEFNPGGVHKRMGVLVVALVLFGAVGLAIGGYFVWNKRQGAALATPLAPEVSSWCEARQAWAHAVNPLVGDIMLKSVKPEDREALEKLQAQRSALCEKYAKQIHELGISSPEVQQVELALVREGKTRANISVEISNLLAKLDELDTARLIKTREQLQRHIVTRIKQGQALADREVDDSLKMVSNPVCSGIYRGPLTDEGTTVSPYTTWDELELQRVAALKQVDARIKELEPVEQFTNRVYHALIQQYRPVLTTCYRRAKGSNPSMSDVLGLRVRLKSSGKVASLAIEWMENRDEKLLDCLLEKAGNWQLPRPDAETRVVVVTLDFKRF